MLEKRLRWRTHEGILTPFSQNKVNFIYWTADVLIYFAFHVFIGFFFFRRLFNTRAICFIYFFLFKPERTLFFVPIVDFLK